MKVEDIKIGMKVIPHSKSVGDSQSSAWNRVSSGASQYLTVRSIELDTVNDPPREPIIKVWDDHPLLGIDDVLSGDKFLASDLEPYIPKTCKMQLTVILRDDSPMWHANDCPKYRTVRIALTAEQCEAVAPKVVGYKGNNSGQIWEEISMCILEESK